MSDERKIKHWFIVGIGINFPKQSLGLIRFDSRIVAHLYSEMRGNK